MLFGAPNVPVQQRRNVVRCNRLLGDIHSRPVDSASEILRKNHFDSYATILIDRVSIAIWLNDNPRAALVGVGSGCTRADESATSHLRPSSNLAGSGIFKDTAINSGHHSKWQNLYFIRGFDLWETQLKRGVSASEFEHDIPHTLLFRLPGQPVAFCAPTARLDARGEVNLPREDALDLVPSE
jgi:hypothetical protein